VLWTTDWEIVGKRDFFCDGSVEEWGYTSFECAQMTITWGNLCYQYP